MKRSIHATVVLATLALAFNAPNSADAALVSVYGILDLTANGGINPNTGLAWQAGDQYRLAFCTAGKIDASADDPAVYDSFATAQANLSTLGNGSITTSTGWTAMVWVNTDDTLPQGVSPVSSPVDRSGTSDFAGGFIIGGAGVPVYAMNGTTAIARNNADIYNGWSNPFAGDTTVRLAAGSTNLDSAGNSVTASQVVHYSPYLNQDGLGDSANVHGVDTWTGGFGSAVNPLGNSVDPDTQVRASWGSSNANTSGRVWNRFQSVTTATLSVYAISPLLTVTEAGGPPFAITAFEFTLSAVPMVPSMISLTWTSKPGARYAVRYTSDLASWPGEFDDSATGDPDSGTTTRSYPFDAVMVAPEGKFFVRVEEAP